ncbi:fungal hydrophobin-domain-containing protein [Scleroderma yunnanense]
MFIRASALLLPVLALSSVAAAAPEAIVARGGDSCSNGTLQCCQTTTSATQTNANLLAGLLGIVGTIPIVGPLFGVFCSPITGVGVGSGANCAQQTVCCQNSDFNGLINVGCTNVNLGL